MFVPIRIYYDKSSGSVIQFTGNFNDSGLAEVPSVEDDFNSYASLVERAPSTVGMLQLVHGQYAEDFAQCNGYRVDVETGSLIFAYPNPTDPEAPPIYQKSLTEKVAELEIQNNDLMLAVAELAVTSEQDKIETQLAIAELASVVMGGVA